MVAEAALLRHGPAIGLPCLHLLTRAGRAAARHLLNNRLASFAGRVIANIDVAIAHDGDPCADGRGKRAITHQVARTKLSRPWIGCGSRLAGSNIAGVDLPHVGPARPMSQQSYAIGRVCERQTASLKLLGFLRHCFVAAAATKQFSAAMKPFFAFRADVRKQPLVIKLPNQTAARPTWRDIDADLRLCPRLRVCAGRPLHGRICG